jgi:hypothetical protein
MAVQRAEGRGKGDRTHSIHKRICGEVIDTSGDFTEMDLTESVHALGSVLRCRAKASVTDLGMGVGLGEHRLVVTVREKSNLGVAVPPPGRVHLYTLLSGTSIVRDECS